MSAPARHKQYRDASAREGSAPVSVSQCGAWGSLVARRQKPEPSNWIGVAARCISGRRGRSSPLRWFESSSAVHLQPRDHAGRCITYRFETAGRALVSRSRCQGGSMVQARAARPFGQLAKTCTRGGPVTVIAPPPVGTGRMRVNASGLFGESDNLGFHVSASVRLCSDDDMGGIFDGGQTVCGERQSVFG